jgi:hypothetical protein
MTQLVGQRCVVCKEPIRTILDGCFCKACSQAVHNLCARSDGLPASPTHCPQCGGNLSLNVTPEVGAGGDGVQSTMESSPEGSQPGIILKQTAVFPLVMAALVLGHGRLPETPHRSLPPLPRGPTGPPRRQAGGRPEPAPCQARIPEVISGRKAAKLTERAQGKCWRSPVAPGRVRG